MDDQAAARPRWVRGPVTPRLAVGVLPVTLLGALLAAVGPLDDLGQFVQAWVWTLLAAAFGITAGWLIAVMLVPSEADLAKGAAAQEDDSA